MWAHSTTPKIFYSISKQILPVYSCYRKTHSTITCLSTHYDHGCLIKKFRSFVHDKTLKVGKMHPYNDIQKISKHSISLSSQFFFIKWPIYLKSGKLAHLSFSIKLLIFLMCMILYKQGCFSNENFKPSACIIYLRRIPGSI